LLFEFVLIGVSMYYIKSVNMHRFTFGLTKDFISYLNVYIHNLMLI